MQKGLVSVVMGVHNEQEDFLRLAVDSICHQTYENIEFIIVDDCSNDECQIVLRELSKLWPIIHLVRNESNLGLTKSLNIGLAISNGEFVARMDADDYSLPDRIEKQVSYMHSHPDVEILGTGVVSFGDSFMFMSPSRGMSVEESKCSLFYSSTLCHPSVMMRKSFLDDNCLKYDETVQKGQDYDMWERCSVYGNLAVMKDVLLYYRMHSKQISSFGKSGQEITADVVRMRRLSRIGIEPSPREYLCHKVLAGYSGINVSHGELFSWLEKLQSAVIRTEFLNADVFISDLRTRMALGDIRCGHLRVKNIPLLLKAAISRVRMKLQLAAVVKRMRFE